MLRPPQFICLQENGRATSPILVYPKISAALNEQLDMDQVLALPMFNLGQAHRLSIEAVR
jgi:hypothetical protein